jgi:hypothetical protein
MYICIFTFITPNTYYQSNSELNAENVFSGQGLTIS